MNTIEQLDDGGFKIVMAVKPGERVCLPPGTYGVRKPIEVGDRGIVISGPDGRWGSVFYGMRVT